MGLFSYNINDPRDRIEDIVTAPAAATMADVQKSEQFAADLRQHHWDNRRITSHGTYFGNPDYQWIAHVPGRVAELLDMRHPGWDTNERAMRAILSKYPGCNVLPEESRR